MEWNKKKNQSMMLLCFQKMPQLGYLTENAELMLLGSAPGVVGVSSIPKSSSMSDSWEGFMLSPTLFEDSCLPSWSWLPP